MSHCPWSAAELLDAQELMALLPLSERVVWRLVVVERRSHAEVASLLGVSVGTLTRRVRRLKARVGGEPMRRLMGLRPVLPPAYFAAAFYCLMTGCGYRRLARAHGLPLRQAMGVRRFLELSQSKGDQDEVERSSECYAVPAVSAGARGGGDV